MLIAASALITTGCKDNTANVNAEPAVSQSSAAAEAAEIGAGATQFTFIVADADGSETAFLVNTDKTIVGDVLLEHGLIEGDDSEYGLFVKKVNGITADFDADGTYWAFYVNGEYAMTGVDSTEITAGSTYSFRKEK